jgi:hypothetical protein
MMETAGVETQQIGEADSDAHLMWRLCGHEEEALATLNELSVFIVRYLLRR